MCTHARCDAQRGTSEKWTPLNPKCAHARYDTHRGTSEQWTLPNPKCAHTLAMTHSAAQVNNELPLTQNVHTRLLWHTARHKWNPQTNGPKTQDELHVLTVITSTQPQKCASTLSCVARERGIWPGDHDGWGEKTQQDQLGWIPTQQITWCLKWHGCFPCADKCCHPRNSKI